MSRGLGKVERAVLECIVNSYHGFMRCHGVGRELAGKHFRLGNAWDTPYERNTVNRALLSLTRKGYLRRLPGPYGIYALASEPDDLEP